MSGHNPSVLPVVFAALAALLFVQAVVRLRRRGRADLAGWDRMALFAAGLGLTLFALVGPLANLAIWHIPYLYDAALAHQSLHDFEHLCWTVCGILVWTLLVDPGSHKRLSVGGRVALATAMFAAGQILSDVLVFTFTPLYPYYHGAYGISALTDQQLSGIVMMAEQLLTLGTCVALLLQPRWRPHLRRLAAVA